jgi:glutamate racemase
LEQVRSFAEEITRYLLDRGAKLIVVACNTASAAALHYLRERFPQTPFVGIEPAVKPAAEYTQSGVVGVLATPATFQGELYASVIERFAQGVTVLQDTCPGLVEQIEKGELDSDETGAILEAALAPMIARGVDRVVMGCTHYPFVIPLIEAIVGPDVGVIDPAPAVARQVERILDSHGLRAAPRAETGRGTIACLTSGDPARLSRLLPRLIGESCPVEGLSWDGDTLR